MNTPAPTRLIHLRRAGTSVVVEVPPLGVPSVLHWGQDLGDLDEGDLLALARTQVPALTTGTPDVPGRFPLVPLQSDGWCGTPGLVASHADGTGQYPLFTTTAVDILDSHGDAGTPSSLRLVAHDDEVGLDLTLELRLEASGLLRLRAGLTNGTGEDLDVDSLLLALPTPSRETLVLDQTGHHLRERDTQTHPFTIGAHVRTTRVARGHQASTVHGTCEPAGPFLPAHPAPATPPAAGAAWRTGSVHYVHVAWSGNTRTVAERDAQGVQGLLAGELLMPGEMRLAPGDTYTSPWVVATHGWGLDQAASRIHEWLRGRPIHPRSPRPVTLNAWEAVYFDHSLDRLLALVDAAASVGVERFVLDDGWFSSRRDDTSGLGDWVVSPEVWPDGLAPLADAVHAHGMQFGLWFEPEMVNPDSQLACAHPDWILSPASHRPQEARHQQVLDLHNPEAFDHVLTQMLAVLDSTRIDYIKWDFNRDLLEARSPLTGRPSLHAQTLATYALMDAVLAAHPALEIESCAGGGGRIDLGVMERCVRVWASDCIDPLERQGIEAGTALLLPPEVVGSHIASPTSHTTGRTLGLATRASTAILSHLGIEWDLSTATAADLRELSAWVGLHRELRPLLHAGTTVHADHPDPGWHVRGVVGRRLPDGTWTAPGRGVVDEGVIALVRMATSAQRPSPALRLPGFEHVPEGVRYRVEGLAPRGVPPIAPSSAPDAFGHTPLGAVPWWDSGVTLPTSLLARVGLRLPDVNPEQVVLLRVTRVG